MRSTRPDGGLRLSAIPSSRDRSGSCDGSATDIPRRKGEVSTCGRHDRGSRGAGCCCRTRNVAVLRCIFFCFFCSLLFFSPTQSSLSLHCGRWVVTISRRTLPPAVMRSNFCWRAVRHGQGGSPVAVAAAIVVSRMIYVTASWLTLTRIVRILDIRNVPGNFVATVRQLWPYGGVDGALTSIWGALSM